MQGWKVGLAATGLVAAALPVGAGAQSLEWIDQAYQRFVLETGQWGTRTPIDWFSMSIAQNQAHQLTIVPQNNGTITFSGACDNDCTRFSIAVYDYQNVEIARYTDDYGGRATTSAYLYAGQSYSVQFYPEDCSESFCYTIGMAYQ